SILWKLGRNDIRRAIPLAITSFYANAFPNQVVIRAHEIDTYSHKVDAVAMRKAMPNAVFFAFSGTPIDKKNRSTYKVFGPLLLLGLMTVSSEFIVLTATFNPSYSD
ncbi:MAG: hypothetical protein WCF03_12425, partial [Nitrososphaeraceae archaeon]